MSLVLQSLLPYPNSCQGTSPHQQGWDTKMAMLSFCGVDVSKDRLDVVVLPEGWFFSVSNDTAGWAELVVRLRPLTVSAIGLEPSGGYERGIIRALLAAGLSVRRINPNKLRQFARARGVLAKNDRLDARLIAEYVAIMPTRVVQRDAAVEKLAEIVTMRRQLCDEHVAAENQAAHLEDASSFDQLVGDGEHAWGHFDAESPRCLNVDDKLEVCRLQHWQIGGPYPVENAAGVDADLTTHVELVSSITHQPASCDIAPLRVSSWHR